MFKLEEITSDERYKAASPEIQQQITHAYAESAWQEIESSPDFAKFDVKTQDEIRNEFANRFEFGKDIVHKPAPEDGLFKGTAKALGKGILGAVEFGGNYLQDNKEYMQSGTTEDSRDRSKLSLTNRFGEFVSDKAKAAADKIQVNPGDSETKRIVFEGTQALPLSGALIVPGIGGAVLGGLAGAGLGPPGINTGRISGAVGANAATSRVMYAAVRQQTLEELDQLQAQGKLRPGVTQAEKIQAAEIAANAEWQGEMPANIVESLIFSRLPAGKALSGILKPGLKQLGKNMIMTAPLEVAGEAYTSAVQTGANNQVLQEEFQGDKIEAAQQSVGPTLFMTAVMNTIGVGGQRVGNMGLVKALSDPSIPIDQRAKAVQEVTKTVQNMHGKEAAEGFANKALEALRTGNALDLEDATLIEPMVQSETQPYEPQPEFNPQAQDERIAAKLADMEQTIASKIPKIQPLDKTKQSNLSTIANNIKEVERADNAANEVEVKPYKSEIFKKSEKAQRALKNRSVARVIGREENYTVIPVKGGFQIVNKYIEPPQVEAVPEYQPTGIPSDAQTAAQVFEQEEPTETMREIERLAQRQEELEQVFGGENGENTPIDTASMAEVQEEDGAQNLPIDERQRQSPEGENQTQIEVQYAPIQEAVGQKPVQATSQGETIDDTQATAGDAQAGIVQDKAGKTIKGGYQKSPVEPIGKQVPPDSGISDSKTVEDQETSGPRLVAEQNGLSYDGESLGIHYFTAQSGPNKGATFTVKNPTQEEVVKALEASREKFEKVVNQQSSKTPEQKQPVTEKKAKDDAIQSREDKGTGRKAPDKKPDTVQSDNNLDNSVEQERQGKVAPKTDDPKKAEAVAGKAEIDDFGEKIGGAKKDTYQSSLADAAKYDTADVPLSKSFPEPNYDKLIEEGFNKKVVALVRAMRDEIPTKPVSSYKKKRWVEQVNMLRDATNQLLSSGIDQAKLAERIGEMESIGKVVAGRAELYEKFGHGKSLKGITVQKHYFSFYKGEENVTKWTVEKKAKATAFSNWPTELGVGNTKEEALSQFAKVYAALGDKKGKEVKFQVYSYRDDPKTIWVGKKVGRNTLDLKSFDNKKDAIAFKNNNQDDLIALLEKQKYVPDFRRRYNEERIGVNHRKGKDVSPDQFTEAFGFRGVEFGNWVKASGERQNALNNAYDAFLDLSEALGIPTQALSLNGELGLAFGARGSGGKNPAAAHYESGKVVINLTRKEGAGSLAHEWWHSLDNYFSRLREKPDGFLTDRPHQLTVKIRQEMADAFKNLVETINKTKIKERSARLDAKRTKKYWQTDIEISARTFESYVIKKLADEGYTNDYLANIVSKKEFMGDLADNVDQMFNNDLTAMDMYPYLNDDELGPVVDSFDRFFKEIKTKKTDKGVALYSKGLPPTEQAQISELTKPQQAIFKRLQDSGKLELIDNERALSLLEGAGMSREQASGNIQGFTMPDGKIYLVIENIGKGNLFRVVLHEVSHSLSLGLKTEREFNGVLRSIESRLNDKTDFGKKLREAKARIPENTIKEHVSSEILAYYIESGRTEVSFVRRLIALVKRKLVSMGISPNIFNGSDLTALVLDSLSYAAKRRDFDSSLVKTTRNGLIANSENFTSTFKGMPFLNEANSLVKTPLNFRILNAWLDSFDIRLDSPEFKSASDAAPVNSKKLPNVIKTTSFLSKGYSGLDAPGKSEMFEFVSSIVRDGKIFNSVVGFDFVDVVNMFGGEKGATEVLLNNPAMLIDLLSVYTDNPVPILSNMSNSVVLEGTGRDALSRAIKLSGDVFGNLTGKPVDNLTTNSTIKVGHDITSNNVLSDTGDLAATKSPTVNSGIIPKNGSNASNKTQKTSSDSALAESAVRREAETGAATDNKNLSVPKLAVSTTPASEDIYRKARQTNTFKTKATRNTRMVVNNVMGGIDKYLGASSTRLRNIHPKIEAKFRKLDFDTGTKLRKDVQSVLPMLDKAKKQMSKEDFADWDFARKNSDIEKINELIEKYDMRKEYEAYRATLNNLRDEANEVGMDIGFIKDYSPRVIIDEQGFLNATNRGDMRPVITDALKKQADHMGITVSEMDAAMRADVVSNLLFGGFSGMGKPGNTKERVIKKIPPHLNQYYMDSDGALVQYLHQVRKHVEMRRFFGKLPTVIADAKKAMRQAESRLRKTEDPERQADIQETIDSYKAILDRYRNARDYKDLISEYIDSLIIDGTLTPENERTLLNIFNARFHEKGTHGIIQGYKNFSYIDTMGNPISAITQIGDLAWTLYANGWMRTIKGVYGSVTKNVRITKEDVGIERIAQEFAGGDTLSKAVAKVFKWVGLEKMDTIGKESFLNAALERFEAQAQKDPAKLKQQIKDIFEDETDFVIEDLQNKRITDNVKLLVYSNLLDFQPVALSEMSEKYLNAGNGRLFYMLKSYTLKQFDVFRREVYTGLKSGDKVLVAKAMRNLVYLSSMLVLANGGADELKDLILGRKTSFEDRVVDNFLRLLGVSKFVTWKARTDGAGSAMVRQILPPFKFFDSLSKDFITIGDDKGTETLQSVPVVGKLAYWHIGRGATKGQDYQEKKFNERKKKLKEISEKAEGDVRLRLKYREEIREYAKVKKLQAKLNANRKEINRLKKLEQKTGRNYSQKIDVAEAARLKMIDQFMQQ